MPIPNRDKAAYWTGTAKTVEVTPVTQRAFRFTKGLAGGLTLLVATSLAMVALTGCGAPAYTYVADSAASTYFKVPYGWHPISDSSLSTALRQVGLPSQGIWSTAYDAGSQPSADHFLAFDATKPFVFSQVGQLTSTGSNSLSYNSLRDWLLPVTSSTRQSDQASGFPFTNFQQIRDQTVTGQQGVHGVRETFQYTYQGVTDTFDEDVLTNADQTTVYFLMVHCTETCYSQNQSDIDTIMSSFTVGSSS